MPVKKSDLKRLRTIGDEEADRAFIEIWKKLSQDEKNAFIKTLGKWTPPAPLTNLPEAVAQYIALPFDKLPDWIDQDRITRAQEAYATRHASGGRIVLAAYSLPILYIDPDISLTLAGTAQLLLHVRRRLRDTQAFTDAVMTPGNLKEAELGRQWIRKIRLTHAYIRMMVNDHPASPNLLEYLGLWDLRALSTEVRPRPEQTSGKEVPLNQVELALVLQTFGWVIVDGLSTMGWSMTGPEADDHIHAWSAIGYMMGIEPEVLPQGKAALDDAEALFVLIRDDLLSHKDPFGPDPKDKNDNMLSGRLLIAAWMTILIQIQREQTPENLRTLLDAVPRLDEALQQMPRILIRRLCGDEAAGYLRIGRAGLIDQLVCRLALLLIDVRKIAANASMSPGSILAGELL
jgi:ER-bound oxygenase mpaB/B'/Rubber oxygenase, catalytic domain